MAYNSETGMYEGYIYCIENLINGKKYIGQTIRTINERWKNHLSSVRNPNAIKYAIHIAIKKYGYENFSITELEKYSYADKKILEAKLDEREIYFIQYYKDNKYKLYNMTKGGDNAGNTFSSKEIIVYNMKCELIYTFPSISMAECELKVRRSDISECCLKNGKINRASRYIFRYKHNPLTKEEIEWYKIKYPQIYQYNYDGELINTYDFIQDAVNDLALKGTNVMNGNISACCNGKVLSCGGYVWRKFPDTFNTYRTPKMLTVEKRDRVTGELIEVFDSPKEVENIYGFDASLISSCCNKQIHTAYNFHWCYKGKFDPKELTLTKKKMIDQYTLDGKFISTYDSISNAIRSLGIKGKSANSSIGAVCSSPNRNHAYGYVWRYHGEPFDKFNNKLFKTI